MSPQQRPVVYWCSLVVVTVLGGAAAIGGQAVPAGGAEACGRRSG